MSTWPSSVFGGEGFFRAAECGAVDAVLDALEAHQSAEGVQERGCSALTVMCSAEEVQLHAVECGAIEARPYSPCFPTASIHGPSLDSVGTL